MARDAFDRGVRWFGPDIQVNGAQIALFVIIPGASVYMSRGLPTFYLAVLYFSLMSFYARHLLNAPTAREAVGELKAVISSPLFLAGAAFCGYASLSFAWAPDPLESFEESVRLIGALLLMVPIVALLPDRERRWHFYLPAIGLALTAILLAIEFGPTPILRDLLYGRNIAFMNRAALVVAFMLWPTLALIGGRHVTLQRLLLFGLCGLPIFSSMSQASMLGYVAGAVATVLAFVAPRLLTWLIGFGVAVAFAAAPFVAPHLGRILHLVGLDPYLDRSNLRRLEIWQAFSEVIWQRPIFGWGIKSSQEFGIRPMPGVEWSIGPAYHPHNTLLQTWVELGVVGVIMCVALVFLLARATLRLPEPRRPFAIGCVVAGVAIASVSHGMWQSWWICIVLGSVAVFLMDKKGEALTTVLQADRSGSESGSR